MSDLYNTTEFMSATRARYDKARAIRDLRRRQLAAAEVDLTRAADEMFARLAAWERDADNAREPRWVY